MGLYSEEGFEIYGQDSSEYCKKSGCSFLVSDNDESAYCSEECEKWS